MKKILIFALMFLFFACPKEETEIEPKDIIDLVPRDNEISGWTRSSAMAIAENETQLYDIINGEGDVYVNNGFVKFVRQYFQGDISGSPVDLQLRIADMADTINAKSIYDETATGSEIPWTDNNAGTEARYKLVAGQITSYYLLDFWEEEFYAWISINDETQAGLDIAKLFALNISDAISDTTETQ